MTAHTWPEHYFGNPADLIEVTESPSPVFRSWLSALHPDWHARALCANEPTDWWFPTRGMSNDTALQICGRCPVRQACLDEAIADPALDYGIRGGMTTPARKTRRRNLQGRQP